MLGQDGHAHTEHHDCRVEASLVVRLQSKGLLLLLFADLRTSQFVSSTVGLSPTMCGMV